MTHATSEAVAKILAAARQEADHTSGAQGFAQHRLLDSLTYDLADMFHRNNHRFSSALFFRAADLRDVKVR